MDATEEERLTLNTSPLPDSPVATPTSPQPEDPQEVRTRQVMDLIFTDPQNSLLRPQPPFKYLEQEQAELAAHSQSCLPRYRNTYTEDIPGKAADALPRCSALGADLASYRGTAPAQSSAVAP